MKLCYTKNPESELFFIKNPNLTKKILVVGRRGEWCVARVLLLLLSDFFLKRIQVRKK